MSLNHYSSVHIAELSVSSLNRKSKVSKLLPALGELQV